jgi:phosphate:Na+ symporter
MQELIFGIIGGLGLFIFGIRIMSDGLKKIAGETMREILAYLTKHRFAGLSLGALVTSIIQSSSATTVMVVGFVNAGLMTLRQAIPVILGANIGTTITAQLIAFKLTDYALPIVGLGAFMYIFAKRRKTRQTGEAILGFGTLFLGLSIMGTAVKTLGTGSSIHNAFAAVGGNPVLGIIVGMIATAIVQSSSVTTGIVVIMSGMGLLDLGGAIPIIFGTNIGTCITAMLASIKTNLTARRTAVAHVTFNVVGTIIAMLLLPMFIAIATSTSTNIGRQVANVHTLFNVFNALIFIGFVPLFASLIKKIVPGEEVIVERGAKYLDKNLLNTPSIAIDASRNEILRTTGFANEMFETAIDAFHTSNKAEIEKVRIREQLVDELRDSITDYLVKITEREITDNEARMIPGLLHSINDIERIGDHAENIASLAERKMEEGIKFSDAALRDMKKMHEDVTSMMDDIIKALTDLDKGLTKGIMQKENLLNQNFIRFREAHVRRLGKGKCDNLAGVVFVDMLSNFEKIGDHITNIAQAIEGKLQWNADDV